MNPSVSIIIPTYNRAALLSETISSVIQQTYSNWELIVVDDGSTDTTAQTINQVNDPRISYHYIEHTGSFGAARNAGIAKARGEFIAFLDSDDLWRSTKLEQQIAEFAESECDFVITHIELFGPRAHRVPTYKAIRSEKLLSRYLSQKHFAFFPSTLIFKKSVLQQTGLMDETIPLGGDGEFFVELCHHCRGSFLAVPLVRIRRHDNNSSAGDPLYSYNETTALLNRIHKKGYVERSIYARAIANLYYKMGLLYVGENKPRRAMKCFARFFLFRPFMWKGWIRLAQTSLLVLRRPLLRPFQS